MRYSMVGFQLSGRSWMWVGLLMVLVLCVLCPNDCAGASPDFSKGDPLRLNALNVRMFQTPGGENALILEKLVIVSCGRRQGWADRAVVWISQQADAVDASAPLLYQADVYLQGHVAINMDRDALVITPADVPEARLFRLTTSGGVTVTAINTKRGDFTKDPLYLIARQERELYLAGELDELWVKRMEKQGLLSRGGDDKAPSRSGDDDIVLPDLEAPANSPAGEAADGKNQDELPGPADMLLDENDIEQLSRSSSSSSPIASGPEPENLLIDPCEALPSDTLGADGSIPEKPAPETLLLDDDDAALSVPESREPIPVDVDELSPESLLPVDDGGEAKKKPLSEAALLIESVDPSGMPGRSSKAVTSYPQGGVPKSAVHIVPYGPFVSQRQPDGSDILICTGGLYLYRNLPAGLVEKQESLLQFHAGSAVVFYNQRKLFDDPNSIQEVVSGVYLEGDVVFQAGYHEITANKLYYDFDQDRALVLDAALHAQLPGENMPIHVRAAEVRQLSLTHFQVRDVKLSNDEFYKPGVWLGASSADLYLKDPEKESSRMDYDLRNVTLNFDAIPVPVFWWPQFRGASVRPPSPLKSVHTTFDSTYGATVETQWDLASLLGFSPAKGVEPVLLADYFSKRGPAVGANVEYRRETYFGNFNSYLVYDRGEDDLGDFRLREDLEPERKTRGRIKWQHRHYLPEDWEMTLELNYLSDRNYLESWEEKEFDTDKEQETVVYLKRQRDNWAFDFLVKPQLNDFDYTIEELPRAGFHVAGWDFANLFNYYHNGYVTRRTRTAGETGPIGLNEIGEVSGHDLAYWNDVTFFQTVSRHEVTMPLHLGTVNIVPTAIADFWYQDEVRDYSRTDYYYGVTASTQFWHVDDNVESRLFDLHRMRHVIIPEVSGFFSDSPDGEPGQDIFNFNLRQRWQTKRGPAENRYTTDFLRWDLGVTLVEDDRDVFLPPNHYFFSTPDAGLAHNDFLLSKATWMISETTAIDNMVNYDLNNDVLSEADLTLAVQRSPRTSYYLGYQYLRGGDTFNPSANNWWQWFDNDQDAQFLTAGLSYSLNRKYTLAAAHQYDLVSTTDSYSQLTVVRRFNRWYGAFSVGWDAVDDGMSFTVSFWPEGFGDVAIGSRRFRHLTD